jgi:hypothetical protein
MLSIAENGQKRSFTVDRSRIISLPFSTQCIENMSMKTFAEKINWPQAVAEISLIVLGILVALAVNNWWEDRLVRQAEIRYLEALNSDFQSNLESLEAAIVKQENVIVAGDEVLKLIKAGLDEESSEAFFSKIGNELYFFHDWTPVTGTYDDLISSGRLLYIHNSELRKELSEFRKSLERIREMERLQTETFYARQSPFLSKYQDVNYYNWSEDYKPPVSPYTAKASSFATLEYWNLVVEWIYIHADIISDYRRKVADCHRILELIETELVNKKNR